MLTMPSYGVLISAVSGERRKAGDVEGVENTCACGAGLVGCANRGVHRAAVVGIPGPFRGRCLHSCRGECRDCRRSPQRATGGLMGVQRRIACGWQRDDPRRRGGRAVEALQDSQRASRKRPGFSASAIANLPPTETVAPGFGFVGGVAVVAAPGVMLVVSDQDAVLGSCASHHGAGSSGLTSAHSLGH